jgi:hypothetical protein
MHNFVSRLQFNIVVGNQPTAAQYEELTILVMAQDKQDAYLKAQVIGRKNEDEFLNRGSNSVCWRFMGVTHLERIGDINDGTILFSELKDDYSPEQLKGIQQRIRKMEEKSLSIPLYTN